MGCDTRHLIGHDIVRRPDLILVHAGLDGNYICQVLRAGTDLLYPDYPQQPCMPFLCSIRASET